MHKIAEQIRRNGGNGHAARIFASPLARRLARELGLELATLNGSGPHGRIVRRDVERAAHATPKAAEAIEPVSEPDSRRAHRERASAGAAPARAGHAERAAGAARALRPPGARALRAGVLRDRAARHDAPLHRRAADAVQADHPAFLSRHRLPARRAARRPRAAERARPAGRPARLQALAQRFHHQGSGHGAANRARPPTPPGRSRAFCAIAPPTSPSRSRSKAAACIPR